MQPLRKIIAGVGDEMPFLPSFGYELAACPHHHYLRRDIPLLPVQGLLGIFDTGIRLQFTCFPATKGHGNIYE